MIALARDLGFDVTLATNGALLTEQRATQLVDLGVRRMHVSFNAAREETYVRLHPGAPPGMLGAVVQRLAAMHEYAERECRRPIDVEFSTVLNRWNMAEIGEMIELAHQARAGWLMLILMGPVQGGEELLLRPEDWLLLREDLDWIEARARRLGIRTNIAALKLGASGAGTRSVYEWLPCHIGHEYALVLADGSVMFCCQCSRPLGNLQQDSFTEIWNSQAYREARREARALPSTRQALGGCECFTACSHVVANLQVYRKLHGDRKLRRIL
jgi:MoaA/NifB/PqqE/SkfB family radical SAM enzyme